MARPMPRRVLVASCCALLGVPGALPASAPPMAQVRSPATRDYPHPRVVKLVLDLDSPTPANGTPNPGLLAIDALIRQYGAFKADAPRLEIVAVLHAGTTELALSAAAGRSHYAAWRFPLTFVAAFAAGLRAFAAVRFDSLNCV